MSGFANPPDEELAALLRGVRTIAVVGLSPNPWRASHSVSAYMAQAGYRIVPVNPGVRAVLGQRAWPRLADVPEPVDLVDIFRRSELAGAHVDEAIAKGARAVWLQEGVWDEAAAARARAAGLVVVMDRCLMVEHRRLLG